MTSLGSGRLHPITSPGMRRRIELANAGIALGRTYPHPIVITPGDASARSLPMQGSAKV